MVTHPKTWVKQLLSKYSINDPTKSSAFYLIFGIIWLKYFTSESMSMKFSILLPKSMQFSFFKFFWTYQTIQRKKEKLKVKINEPFMLLSCVNNKSAFSTKNSSCF